MYLSELRYEDICRDYLTKGSEYMIVFDENDKLISIVRTQAIMKFAKNDNEMIATIKMSTYEITSDSSEKLADIVGKRSVHGIVTCEINVITEVRDDQDVLGRKYDKLYYTLAHKGINTVKVRVPTSLEVVSSKASSSQNWLPICFASFYSSYYENTAKSLLNKLTTISYEQLKGKYDEERYKEWNDFIKTPNSEKRIFLVGPCIANWGSNLKSDAMGVSLVRKLKCLGEEISVICIGAFRNASYNMYNIFEYDLTNKDIVFMIEESNYLGTFEECDINLLNVYNSYDGDKFLYYNTPIHATVFGIELIINEMINKIIPWSNACKGKKTEILVPKNSCQQEDIEVKLDKNRIDEYLNKNFGMQNKPEEVIGAIVMNANPFTKGHRYLVEYALQQVEHLIIFVVEEDASLISFCDRIALVRAGVSDLEHITVVPSGEFIISKTTFKGYFEKEEVTQAIVDAANDIELFGTHIAPALGITKRFVGEEPIDYITYQYNEQMKKQLKSHGIELIEIPRKKEQTNDEVISASKVRKVLEDGDFSTLKELVDKNVYEYLKDHKEYLHQKKYCREVLLKKKMEEANIKNPQEVHNIQEVKKFIEKNKKVIFYGTGIDAIVTVLKLSKEELDKVCFCDKKAESKEYEFMGKKVNKKEQLSDNGYGIVITTKKYAKEIFLELLNQKISQDRILIVK